jgi:hypothetical protein
MRLISIVKLTLANGEEKYFASDIDAILQKSAYETKGEIKLTPCLALQHLNNYWLVEATDSYRSNSNFKEKDRIYQAKIDKQHQMIELGGFIMTPTSDAPAFYLDTNNRLFYLKTLVRLETPRQEFAAIKNDIGGVIALARTHIAAERTLSSQQQRSFQIWPQLQRAQEAYDDPMDIDKPTSAASGFSSF